MCAYVRTYPMYICICVLWTYIHVIWDTYVLCSLQTTIHYGQNILCHSPDYFPTPGAFLPERWLNKDADPVQHRLRSFIVMPFGFGPRSCIGKALAERQIQLLVFKVGARVRSGQVRSECLTCTVRASCCSARLSRAQVPTFAGSFVRDRNGCSQIHYVLFRKEGGKEIFYLTTHSTHFMYGYMASDISYRTIQIVREETRCRHMGYSSD